MARVSISLFAGAGGIDCGVEAAGFSTAVALDSDFFCAESLRANRFAEIVEADIASVEAREVLARCGVRSGDVDLLTAGPPCQPFSKSANWRYGVPLGLKDPRATTLRHMMRLIEGTLPRVVMIENVPGFAGTPKQKTSALKRVEGAFRRINARHGTSYALSREVLDAADFGVPQHRRRLIVVADREGREFDFPSPTHGAGGERFVTAWDAIGNLRERANDPELQVRGRWAELLASIPEGENYLWHTDRGGGRPLFGWRTRYWNFLLKLAKERPSWTLAASPSQNSGPFHWKNRLLSAREMARLQSFPDHWEFVGTRAQQVSQIGNAVPPLLAEVVARAIRVQLLGDRTRTREPRLAIETRTRRPPAEPILPVPRAYLALAGAHRDHPGHGRGPGARKRKREQQKEAALAV